MQIFIEHAERLRELPLPGQLGFGRHFTDHMFVMDFTREGGWHSPRVVPYRPFSVDPATLVLHYGQSIFEGLKAYRWDDDSINIFRAHDHVARLARSAERMVMPEFDQQVVLDGLTTLVDMDRRWVPGDKGTALYIRPTMIASENLLGVRPSDEYRLFIILSPVGSYYLRGMAPTRIWAEETYSRVPLGGTGEAKTGGNYAASLKAAAEARAKGYDQVLWLDAKEHRYVEEVGTMNVCFVIDDTLITPPLGGTILDGITRRSVIALAREMGVNVEERRIAIDEVIEANKTGHLQEAFGCGTAAVIAPIGTLHWHGTDYDIAERPDSLREKLYNAITDIQYGRVPDTHNWNVPVPHLQNGANGNGSKKHIVDKAAA